MSGPYICIGGGFPNALSPCDERGNLLIEQLELEEPLKHRASNGFDYLIAGTESGYVVSMKPDRPIGNNRWKRSLRDHSTRAKRCGSRRFER